MRTGRKIKQTNKQNELLMFTMGHVTVSRAQVTNWSLTVISVNLDYINSVRVGVTWIVTSRPLVTNGEVYQPTTNPARQDDFMYSSDHLSIDQRSFTPTYACFRIVSSSSVDYSIPRRRGTGVTSIRGRPSADSASISGPTTRQGLPARPSRSLPSPKSAQDRRGIPRGDHAGTVVEAGSTIGLASARYGGGGRTGGATRVEAATGIDATTEPP